MMRQINIITTQYKVIKKGQYKSTLFNQPISYKMGIDFYDSYYSDKVIIGTYYKRTANQIT